MNMAEQYNSTHPGSIINLEKYNKIEELIIYILINYNLYK